MGDSLFVRNTSNNTIETSSVDTINKDTILFNTFNILNDKCIHRNGSWSFATDPEGEDMGSSYGTPHNRVIKTIYPKLNGSTTIANQEMLISFSVKNVYNRSLYFSSFIVKVIKTYNAKAEQSKYNLYETRSDNELKLSVVTLNNKKNYYPSTTYKEPISVNGALICNVKITGDNSCKDLIYNFKIIIDFIDDSGNHYSKESDKSYFIAFKNKK